MSELHIPHHLITRRLSKVEMTRQFLEDSIFTIEFHMGNARAADNNTAQAFSDLLNKMRHMLCDLPTSPRTSSMYTPKAPKKPRRRP